jgi:hypothetical protein
MKYRLVEYCNGEAIKVKTCLSKQEAKATTLLWKSAPCEHQYIGVEYLGDDDE